MERGGFDWHFTIHSKLYHAFGAARGVLPFSRAEILVDFNSKAGAKIAGMP